MTLTKTVCLICCGYLLLGCNSEISTDKTFKGKSSIDSVQVTVDSTSGISCLKHFKKEVFIDYQDQDTIYNQLDGLGRRQGFWKDSIDGHLFKFAFYKNGKLDGLLLRYGDGRREQMYKNGQRHGLHKWFYSVNDPSPYSTAYYENDSLIWHAFPWEMTDYLIPIKGYSCRKDSVLFKMYYESGELMYQGVITNTDPRIQTTLYPAKGIHKAYYQNGQLKARIDYDDFYMEVYDSMGVRMFQDSLWKWRGRTISLYYPK